VVEEVEISYTLFASDGTPIRAKAQVTFKQSDFMDDILPAQNPTSRTDARKTRIVNSQHRLDLIAYEEYNDSRYWRVLAEANHLDNPFTLQDGQVLIIPQNELFE
jgi:nucleoid-associated protein YgaU